MSVIIKNLKSEPVFSDIFFGQLTETVNSLLDEQNLSEGEVGVVIADDAMLLRLNREYRNKDKTTDVLSFSYLEPQNIDPHPTGEFAVGDIYISVDRASEQAEQAGHSLEREIFLLTVHGMLHILGFDHSEEIGAKLMREKERMFMERYDRDFGGGEMNG
ncbi:MAG: rRNA maturation RNase YbeY [Bacillota bacterium]